MPIQRDRSTAIPAYSLYGESDGSAVPGFAHVETVAARSALHDWEIAPHRHHRAIQVLILEDGTAEVSLDGVTRLLAGPCQVTVPVGAVHGFRFAPATRGWVVTLGQEFASRILGPDDPLGQLLSAGGASALEPVAARRIMILAEELLRLDPRGAQSYLFHCLAEALLRSLPEVSGKATGRDPRLGLFRHLVEIHLAEHRPISFYAASLGVTMRTLNRLCLRQLGCTPLEAVNRRLAAEAQRLLRYTNGSITQVADQLGFTDPSYFSRFYLRMTGRRPSAEQERELPDPGVEHVPATPLAGGNDLPRCGATGVAL